MSLCNVMLCVTNMGGGGGGEVGGIPQAHSYAEGTVHWLGNKVGVVLKRQSICLSNYPAAKCVCCVTLGMNTTR